MADRYILQSDAINVIDEWLKLVDERFDEDLKAIRRDIYRIPIADAVPAKRSRWIKDPSGVILCPFCGEEHSWVTFRAPYCDNCGAELEPEDGYYDEG